MEKIVLNVQNLSKIYPHGEVKAIDRLSFSVPQKSVVGLLGPNGAGKTTAIKCICSLIVPTEGNIFIDEVDVLKSQREALQKVALVMEGNRNIYWRMTVKENLDFFAGLQGLSSRREKTHIEQLIDLFELREKARTQARELSRGMQQKLAIACTLVKRTELLILDEPTLGLDVESSLELRQVLKEMARQGEKTILLSTHDMNTVQEVCERVVILSKGKIVADERIENLKKIFQASAYRFEIEGKLDVDRQSLLRRQFEMVTLRDEEGHTVIEAELFDNKDVYPIIDFFREQGNCLLSVGRQYPNLEQIFLKIVKGENGGKS